MTLTTNPGRTNSDIETIKIRGLEGAEFSTLDAAQSALESIAAPLPVAVEIGSGGYALYADQGEADADAAEGNRAAAYLE